MESSDATKWRSLKKELSKVLRQSNPDKEHLLMLETEIARLESKIPTNTSGGGNYTNSLIKK